MKKIIFTIALLIFAIDGLTQQEFMVHYMYSGLALNPAYAGVHGGMSTSLLLREQWVGIEGAPSTQLFSIHSPLSHWPVSLGAAIFKDKLGVSSEIGGYFSYAYRLDINNTLKLSMGIQASTHNFKLNYAADNGLADPGDNLNNISELKWNFGTGLLLHSDRFYLGASVPQILNKELDVDDSGGTFSKLIRHYYVTASYAFDVGPNLVVKPNLLMKAVENAPVQFDLNANVLVKKRFGLVFHGVQWTA